MSLLYKALKQASQQNTQGAASEPGTSADPDHWRVAAVAPGAANKRWPVARIMLIVLLVIIGGGTAALFLAPEQLGQMIAPDQTVTAQIDSAPVATEQPAVPALPQTPPEQMADGPVETAQIPMTPQMTEPVAEPITAPSEPDETVAAEKTTNTKEKASAAEAVMTPQPPQSEERAAPPAVARIGAASDVKDTAPLPAKSPQSVAKVGVEKFVTGQVEDEALAALEPPAEIISAPPVKPRKAREMKISNDTVLVRAQYASASRLLMSGQAETALGTYDKLLQANPADRVALLGRAAALQKLGQVDAALSAYENVLAAFPGDKWALNNLLALVSRQEPDKALRQLERIYALNPDRALVPAQIGMIQLTEGRYELAARYFERAVILDPGNAKYAFNLAIVYDKWGLSKPALQHYERALRLALQSTSDQIPVDTVRRRMAYLDVN